MKIAVAAPYLSEIRLNTGYSPFLRDVVTSALLAALLVKFSSIIAPWWGVQATSWAVSFLYLYFALARAAFVRTHCIARGKELDQARFHGAALGLRASLMFERDTRSAP